MNLLPTKSSSSSLIVSIGNTKTANLPYQAPIIALLYPRVRLSKWSSELRYQALWLEIWNRSPTIWGPDLRYQAFRVKSSILNRRTTISDPYLPYQASCIRFSKWSSDLRYQAPLWEIWNRRPTISGPDLRYQALRVKSSYYYTPVFKMKLWPTISSPFSEKYEIADQPDQAPAYDINHLTLVCQYIASNCNISDPHYS